jgi:hypothetical protein
MADDLYWIRPGQAVGQFQLRPTEGSMTYLEVGFRYGAAPGENELRAINSMREVYGIRRVLFDEKGTTVRVEFDASRLQPDAVASMLRQAGIDVRERLALA